MDTTTARHSAAPGLMEGLATLLRHTTGLLVARLELAAVEMTEVRDHLLQLLLLFALGMLCTLFALACGTAIIVVLAWESMGWTILLLLFGVFLVATLLLAYKGRALLLQDKLCLQATMDEFRHDRDLLL